MVTMPHKGMSSTFRLERLLSALSPLTGTLFRTAP